MGPRILSHANVEIRGLPYADFGADSARILRRPFQTTVSQIGAAQNPHKIHIIIFTISNCVVSWSRPVRRDTVILHVASVFALFDWRVRSGILVCWREQSEYPHRAS